MKRVSDKVKEQIKEMRNNGYRIKYICKILNVSKSTVVRYGVREK